MKKSLQRLFLKMILVQLPDALLPKKQIDKFAKSVVM